MSSVNDILANQKQLSSAIENLYSNFKKDGESRKTAAYIKKRLDILDNYWFEYEGNFAKLMTMNLEPHMRDYIEKDKENVSDRYGNVRAHILSCQGTAEERPPSPLIKPPTFMPKPSEIPGQDRALPSGSKAAGKVSTGSESRTEEMLKKQTSNFKAFHRTLLSINLDAVSEKWEFEDLLQTIQSRWAAIDSLHWELDSQLDGSNEEYERAFSSYESKYQAIKKAINKKLWSTAHIAKSTPQMEIPSFSGNYNNWTSFKDLFNETIHSNNSISKAQKMQYLKSKVKGEAERLIQHLQTLVLSGLLCCSISNGYIFGQMSGMLAALQTHEDGTSLTDNDISWIASSINMTSIFGFALAAIVTEKLGRRRAFTFFSVPIIVNWVMLYYAEEMIVFMVSRIVVGVCFGGVLSMYVITTPEYTSPKIRGLFLNMMTSVGPGVGTALGHIFGILFHWRIVALIGIIPTALGAILPLFWEESPSWLASKGKFDKCDKAFRKLHGHRASAETELQILTELEKCKLERVKDADSTAYIFQKFMMACKKRYFWKILLLSCVINIYIAAAGKLLFSTLAITMLEEITGSKDILLFTLLVDGFVVLGTILSCIMVKIMKMRTLLFTTGVTANILLVILSACMYFNPEKSGYIAWINCGLLALYFITVNAGPYPVLEAFIGEIFPLELKAYCFFLSGIVLSLMMFLSIKLANNIFSTLGYHGAFLLNAVIMSACLGYVWIRLPETKGRTLQEIELYFKNDTFDEVNKVLNGEQIKVLI